MKRCLDAPTPQHNGSLKAGGQVLNRDSDFFVVPTVTWRHLYVLVVLGHRRRTIRRVAVTAHPSADWTARQIAAAFPGTAERPKFLVHDRDRAFQTHLFLRLLEAMGIEDRKTAPRSPWMNCYCERLIGTIRRECTDHLLVLGERHLQRRLDEYVAYYNAERTHIALEGNAPAPRRRAVVPADQVIARPVLGGLHHTYREAA